MALFFTKGSMKRKLHSLSHKEASKTADVLIVHHAVEDEQQVAKSTSRISGQVAPSGPRKRTSKKQKKK